MRHKESGLHACSVLIQLHARWRLRACLDTARFETIFAVTGDSKSRKRQHELNGPKQTDWTAVREKFNHEASWFLRQTGLYVHFIAIALRAKISSGPSWTWRLEP